MERPVQPSCKAGESGYCTSPNSVPEQINIQIAGTNSVVISFVTFHEGPPTKPPRARIGTSKQRLTTTVDGVTYVHTTNVASGPVRTLYMHCIRVDNLVARKEYFYT